MTQGTFTFNELRVNCHQVNQCSYSFWSSYFAGNVPEAKVLRCLPPAFLEYLNSESIRLPPQQSHLAIQSNSDNEYSDWEDENEGRLLTDPCSQFADLDELVQDAVKEWGAVMPKMNWSAPKDARWILINNSARCTSNADIYLLLNASDHIAHDLDNDVYDECEDVDEGQFLQPELVIKKWIADLNPALEFRIFVKDRKILGVCQRDLNHYQFLADLHSELHRVLTKFYKDVLQPSQFPLQNYIMDVYVPRPLGAVTIIDVNPLTRKWDSILFTWHELLEKENDGEFELRLITESNMGAMARKDHSENQVPIEIVDASMNTDAMVELAKAFSERD